MDVFHSEHWVEENGDELVINDIPLLDEKKLDNKSVGDNKIDQRFKEEKILTIEFRILIDSYMEETTNMNKKMD